MINNYDKNDPIITTEIFDDKLSAEKAYQEAINQGYKPEEINIVMSEDSKQKYYGSSLIKKEGKKDICVDNLALGSALGSALCGTLAAIAAIGSNLVFPGLGGFIISGPIAAGLVGISAGSIAGGLAGAFIGWGIPEDKAKKYEKNVKSGGIILGVYDHETKRDKLKNSWEKYRNPSMSYN